MFLLPNNQQINYEAIIDAMLDKANAYWLDASTGGCYPESILIDLVNKPDFEVKVNKRYFEIPKISDFSRRRFMVEYVEEMVEFENREFAKRLKEILKGDNARDNFVKILEEKEDEGWIYGWSQWEGDSAFEEMKKWFMELPFEINEEMDNFGCDCPICQTMAEGKTSEEELKDAFRKANFKNILDDIYKKDK